MRGLAHAAVLRGRALAMALVWVLASVPASRALAAAAPPALPFVPFELHELIDPQTGRPAQPGARFEVIIGGETHYRGTPERLLQILNGLERQQAALGRSLRTHDPLWTSVATDAAALSLQLLHGLGITQATALARVRPPLEVCPQLTRGSLRREGMDEGFVAPREMLLIEDEVYLSAEDFVARINLQQDLLCALGWDMLDGVGTRDAPPSVSAEPARLPTTTVAALLARRDAAMQAFGISRHHPTFAMRPVTPLLPLGALTAAAAAAAARSVPTVLDLRRLRGELPALPAYELPEMPAIEVVEAPPPRPLALHKHKRWDGLHLGDRGNFAAEVDGHFTLDGTEATVDAEAVGQASVYVAGHEVRVLRARAAVGGSREANHGSVVLEVMGRTIAQEERSHPCEVRLSSPRLLNHEFRRGFHQRLALGPVPVEFTEGVSAHVTVGSDIFVAGTELGAALIPATDASVYLSGALGTAEAFAIGVGSNLVLLEMNAPLQGRSRLALEQETEPALVSHIDVGLGYDALRGDAYVFAMVPMPRWGLPPWQLRRVEHSLFGWPGFAGRHRLIGWGQHLTVAGIRLLGDLNDQDDLDQAATLRAAIDAERRLQEVARLENTAAEREARVFAAIQQDTGGAATLQVLRDAQHVAREGDVVAALAAPYLDNLNDLLLALRQDAGG